MAAFYYLDRIKKNGVHHIHQEVCGMRETDFPLHLGLQKNPLSAKEEAEKYYHHIGFCT